MAAPEVSVILATRNRAERLRQALGPLGGQQTGGRFSYEVVIVDNGSTDATRQAVEALQADFPAPLRYVYEAQVGKPFALNAGIRRAQGQLLAFIDDDVAPERTWLLALWSSLADEGADAVAGRVLPNWENEPPAWLAEGWLAHLNQLGLGCIDHGPARRRSWDGEDCRWVGGNMAVRRQVVERIGGFHEALVRGQDSEYYERCLQRGARVIYEPSASAHHGIRAERLTRQAFRQWRVRQGYYDAAAVPWKLSHLITIMPLWRWRLTGRRAWAWLGARLARSTAWERFYSGLTMHEEIGAWSRRLQEWPRRWLAVITRKPERP